MSSAPELKLPDTSQPPDHTYFDGQVISWDFVVDGQRATLGHIQPDFNEEFPVSEGGEGITLHEPAEGAHLGIIELGGQLGNRVNRVHILEHDGDSAFVPGGGNMRVSTAGKAVQYVCVYPDQRAEV